MLLNKFEAYKSITVKIRLIEPLTRCFNIMYFSLVHPRTNNILYTSSHGPSALTRYHAPLRVIFMHYM